MKLVSAQSEIYQDRFAASRWRVEKPNPSNSLQQKFRRDDPPECLELRARVKTAPSQFETRGYHASLAPCLDAGFATQVLMQILGSDETDRVRAVQAYAAALKGAPRETIIRSI